LSGVIVAQRSMILAAGQSPEYEAAELHSLPVSSPPSPLWPERLASFGVRLQPRSADEVEAIGDRREDRIEAGADG
jgi:hypothetical protein